MNNAGVAKLIVCGVIIVLFILKLIFQAIVRSIRNRRYRKNQKSQPTQRVQPQYCQQAYQYQRPQYQQPQYRQQTYQQYQQPQYQQPRYQQPQLGFHMAVNGLQMGPYNMPQLAQMAQKEQLTQHSLLWRQGMSRWMRAVEIPETAVLFTPPQLP